MCFVQVVKRALCYRGGSESGGPCLKSTTRILSGFLTEGQHFKNLPTGSIQVKANAHELTSLHLCGLGGRAPWATNI